MRFAPVAAALGAMVLLSGCPSLPGLLGKPTLDPKILAVTKSKQGIPNAQVSLSWDAVNNASTYTIARMVATGSYAPLDSVDRPSYVDSVIPNVTLTYTIEALSPSGDEVVTSAPKTVQVLDAKVGKPTALTVDGNVESNGSAAAKSSKPLLTWNRADQADFYYVTLNEGADGGKVGKLVFAAFTKDPSIKLGDALPYKDVTLAGFSQLPGDALVKNKIYLFAVSAIRTSGVDLGKATAIDVAAGDDTVAVPFI